jgi:two-component system, chemotaxis family, sensor kinase CheA
VNEAVHRLRGRVAVETEEGKFFKCILLVPSAMDILDVFVASAGAQDFLVPMRDVRATMTVKNDQLHRTRGEVGVVFEGKPLRLIDLSATLGFSNKVERLVGKMKLVIRPTGRLLRSKFFSGAGIMPDGRPAFLLEIPTLSEEAYVSKAAASERSVRYRPTILVVDDSLTTRMLEKAILESAGYEAVLARDAEEALEILNRNTFNLIVVDFEMPGMNGLELTRSIRQKPQSSEIPILMLTSRGSDEDKRKGLAAGVQAYLVKGKFDQGEFLRIVAGLLGEEPE